MNRLIYRLTFVNEANYVLRFECPTYASSGLLPLYGGIVEYSKEYGWSTYSTEYVPASRTDNQEEYQSEISNSPGSITLSATTDGWVTGTYLSVSDSGVTVSSPSTGSNNDEIATTAFVNTAITTAIGTAIGGSY